MSTCVTVRNLAICGLAALLAVPVVARAASPTPREEHPGVINEPRPGADADLPTDGQPIVATVVNIDETAGRVTLDTPHGRIDLSVSQEVAERLTPGDVVVLRLTEEEADSPSASPREEESTPEPRNKI
jgi:hypothetical protein